MGKLVFRKLSEHIKCWFDRRLPILVSQSVSGQLSGFNRQSRTKPVCVRRKLLTFQTIHSSLP